MYDNLPWSASDLQIIKDRLARNSFVPRQYSLAHLRAEAMERHQTAIAPSITNTDESESNLPHSDFDNYASDMIAVRHTRHCHTNYAGFWKDYQKTPLGMFLWLIGFLKVSAHMKYQFPKLANAISLETIARINTEERMLLRDTVLYLADERLDIPEVPYSELRSAGADLYNENHNFSKSFVFAMHIPTRDKSLEARVKNLMVEQIISEYLEPAVRRLAPRILDEYTAAVVRERVYRNALTTLARRYPPLSSICKRHIKESSENTARCMDIHLNMTALTIHTPMLDRVCFKALHAYNYKHMADIRDGKKPKLHLIGASQEVLKNDLPAIRALAVPYILSRYSRCDEFMDIAGTMPEPMVSIQKDKIRRLFLEKVQEHYPELTDAVQAELRLLTPKPEAAIAS